MPPRIAAKMKLIALRVRARAVRVNRLVASLLATILSASSGSAVLLRQHFVRAKALTALPDDAECV